MRSVVSCVCDKGWRIAHAAGLTCVIGYRCNQRREAAGSTAFVYGLLCCWLAELRALQHRHRAIGLPYIHTAAAASDRLHALFHHSLLLQLSHRIQMSSQMTSCCGWQRTVPPCYMSAWRRLHRLSYHSLLWLSIIKHGPSQRGQRILAVKQSNWCNNCSGAFIENQLDMLEPTQLDILEPHFHTQSHVNTHKHTP